MEKCCPIIYVRGYAMTQGEIDDTTADPFCGFNLGSTVYRATADREQPPRKFVFESPVVRLASDFGYRDVFEDGKDILDDDWQGKVPLKSIIVYHYYDEASKLLGKGKTPPIERFAQGLSDLILKLRDLVSGNPDNQTIPGSFRCYLVAHSMGGLVCRAFLQNPKLGSDVARKCVDKVFTYATPHNGIEMAGINVPSWLSKMDMSNFNRDRMAEYLGLKKHPYFKKTDCVNFVPDPEKYFCMIGTNRSDYEVAMGLSRTFVGHGSDGLVRIENASVVGDGTGDDGDYPRAASAYAYRAHSGYFGIVNSEEAYQNLVRFLFGDVRVDIWADIATVSLPREIQQDAAAVDALYQFEVLASPRGKRWYLTRRVSEEDSVACRSHKDILAGKKTIYLSTVFLANSARVDKDRASLAYSLTLGVRVPDYEVERKLWFDKHYEGGYLFRDTSIIELTPPQSAGAGWQVSHGWQSKNGTETPEELTVQPLENSRKIQVEIPFEGASTAPSISGSLRFVVSGWNR